MKTYKVVIFMEEHEEITPESEALLKDHQYELFYVKELTELLSNETYLLSDGLLVRGAIIDETLIRRMPNLKVIARAGVGTENIDIAAATENKVYVCNVPDANFNSVAEHVIGMILALSHQIVNGDKEIRTGNFAARHYYIGSELVGKTIGIIGFGRIGQLVAQKCVVGFNMNVLAYDPYVKKTKLEQTKIVHSVDEIFTQADFI